MSFVVQRPRVEIDQVCCVLRKMGRMQESVAANPGTDADKNVLSS